MKSKLATATKTRKKQIAFHRRRERRGKLFPKKGKIDYATTTSLLGEQTPFKKVKPEEKFVEIS